MIKRWKREIENRRDKAKNYLISGENTVEIRNNDTQLEVVIADILTSPLKEQTTTTAPVMAAIAISFPTKMDIINNFTLNNQQVYTFMIVTSHLDGDYTVHTSIFFDFLLTEYH